MPLIADTSPAGIMHCGINHRQWRRPIGENFGSTSRFLDQAFEIGAFGATEANGELIVLPCADWPLKAEFVRGVSDLLVSGHDGESFAICD